MKIKNIVLTGVGGQGVILASNITSNAIFKKGLDVKVSSIKGMSQRLGSAVSIIRYGKKVYSPTTSKIDYLVGFELLETSRYINFLKEDGVGIVNNYKVKIEDYLTDIIKRLKGRNFLIINCQEELNNQKIINLFFLGALSKYLDIEKRYWIESIKEIIPLGYVNINLKAFESGINYNR